MSESNIENQETAIEAPRDHNKVAQELKNNVGKLARQEAKATESDSLAATFNKDIMDMATGAVQQTPTRSIQTVSTEQAKHVKRAAKIRENNTELAATIRELKDEYSLMIDALLVAYPVAEDSEGTDPELDAEEVESEEEAEA